jgi:hypothetical protein
MVNGNTMRAFYVYLLFDFLLFGVWLSASLLLPFMALLRWGGTKWKGLHWLTSSRNRWLLIWGCFGLVKTIALGALLMFTYLPGSPPFDFQGWARMLVWVALRAIHLSFANQLVPFLLGLSLEAVVDAAMYSAFAAIVWWAYSWFTREAGAHRRDVAIQRYGICVLLSACALGIANEVHSWRPVPCSDCFWPHGIPFTFFHEGGFAGGESFVWSGVVGDGLVILLFGAILGWAWNRLSRKHSIVNGIAP